MKNAKIEEVKTNLLEINDVIKQLDESLRDTALQVLVPMYFPETSNQDKSAALATNNKKEAAESAVPDTGDLGNFIASFENSKPAETVLALVAWLYSQYGVYPISTKEIEELGASCGLIIPNRPDNTMRQAKNDGKGLFRQQGKGWSLTVSGEAYMKSQFNVKKGNKPLPKE